MTATARTLQVRMPKPHDAQAQIMASPARFKVVCCGRRFGKTSFIPRMRIKRMLQGEPGSYYAPNYKMLQQFYRDTKDLLAPIITNVSKQEHRFEFIGGGSLTMWSLDSPDTARGRKYGFADIDEAAMIPSLEDAFNAVIRPTLSDLEGDAGFWSTPRGLNYFQVLYARGEDPGYPEWQSFRFPTSANPFIKQSEIDAAQLDLPQDVFRQEYMAEFIQGEGAVFRNITANLYAGGETPEEHKGHVLVAGVDWGAVNDFTAISIACETCGKELELDRFNKIDWEFQRARLLSLLDKWNVSFCLGEENSIGSPNLEALAKSTKRTVKGFQTTAQSKPPLIQSLALCLEQEEMKWLNVPIATRELEAYEATRNEVTNRIQYSAPQGFHDDTVIARALVREAVEQRKRSKWSQGTRRIW
jgi:hypothetical protein